MSARLFDLLGYLMLILLIALILIFAASAMSV